LPGTDPQARARLLVVSGHYDSRASDVMDATSEAPGANDDASGVAAVMEMACVMAAQRYPATLVFMAVAGEEQGLLGAEFWAERARRDGLRVDAMITNDIIGSPVGDIGQRDAKQVRLFADGLSPLLRLALSPTSANKPASDAAFADALRQQIDAQARAGGSADFATNQLGRHLKTVGERYLPGFSVNLIQRPDRYLRGGDHLPFLARGFAAVRFTEPFENFLHQHQNVRTENGVRYGDLAEFVDTAYVADIARINLAGLATLAKAPATPQEVFIETLELSNDTTLRWRESSSNDVAGYRVLWRETGSAVWQQQRDVGKVTRTTLKGLSKDNLIFGVQALSSDGHASLAAFPLPLRK
jgi:Peptidase family M28/Fibronectin type III domain